MDFKCAKCGAKYEGWSSKGQCEDCEFNEIYEHRAPSKEVIEESSKPATPSRKTPRRKSIAIWLSVGAVTICINYGVLYGAYHQEIPIHPELEEANLCYERLGFSSREEFMAPKNTENVEAAMEVAQRLQGTNRVGAEVVALVLVKYFGDSWDEAREKMETMQRFGRPGYMDCVRVNNRVWQYYTHQEMLLDGGLGWFNKSAFLHQWSRGLSKIFGKI